MTETDQTSPDGSDAAGSSSRRRSGGLSGMLLADLKTMAAGLGIRGAGSMRKAQLVEAIKAAQGQSQSQGQGQGQGQGQSGGKKAAADRDAAQKTSRAAADDAAPSASASAGTDGPEPTRPDRPEQGSERNRSRQQDNRRDRSSADRQRSEGDSAAKDQSAPDESAKGGSGRGGSGRGESGRADRSRQQDKQQQDRSQQDKQQQDKQDRGPQDAQASGDDEGGSRRNRRRRGRERDRPVRGREPDTSILEDDVLVPAAGILDVLENYAFVRTTGYLPGPDDVYVSLSMVRKHGLRRGDAVVGQVRQPREGERREKFNPLVRIDSINGADPESALERAEFPDLTPVHPDERLRLESGPTHTTGRIIDLVAPVGKGQRGLIVSPQRAGRTTVLQGIAASITANNPECHLMVLLIDERPEDVTDYQRSIKGEVIASTFDRPPADHTTLAELAIERAKRLVELGHDVVVLLDSITHLGRAYNLIAPASGRVLASGVDANALHPPKRFFGAARNVEDGGSLTILATALVDTGAKTDEVLFEELAGTSNMELRLDRDLAERRVFPAVDPVRSGTRREEVLVGSEEQAILWRLRDVLAEQEPAAALGDLLERLRKTQTNIELLTQVQRSAGGTSTGG